MQVADFSNFSYIPFNFLSSLSLSSSDICPPSYLSVSIPSTLSPVVLLLLFVGILLLLQTCCVCLPYLNCDLAATVFLNIMTGQLSSYLLLLFFCISNFCCIYYCISVYHLNPFLNCLFTINMLV
jgi:hypothetical protein